VTKVPVVLQKLIFKGSTIKDGPIKGTKIVNGSKVLLMGSTK
jgi:hypothetical protein